MELIDRAMLDEVTAAARGAARGRKNRNFHRSEGEPSQRLLNAVEPRSYVAPHRHADPSMDETFVLLRGRLGVVTFDASGAVQATALLEPGGERLGVTVPAGTFHSVVSLEAGTVYFESKAGPYRPLQPDERAPWAPGEQAPAASEYLERLRRLFT